MNRLEKQLEENISTLDSAIARAQANINTDLSRMTGDIERICNKIKALPPHDAQKFEGVMLRMIAKLEEFAGELYSMKQRLEEKKER